MAIVRALIGIIDKYRLLLKRATKGISRVDGTALEIRFSL
jgi:hypothetical protein